MKKTMPVSIRMSPELKDAIAALAADDRRSLSVYIELVLEEHVSNHRARTKK